MMFSTDKHPLCDSWHRHRSKIYLSLYVTTIHHFSTGLKSHLKTQFNDWYKHKTGEHVKLHCVKWWRVINIQWWCANKEVIMDAVYSGCFTTRHSVGGGAKFIAMTAARWCFEDKLDFPAVKIPGSLTEPAHSWFSAWLTWRGDIIIWSCCSSRLSECYWTERL